MDKKILSIVAIRHEKRIMTRKCPKADPVRDGGQESGTPPPWKITKQWSSLAMLVRIPWKIINHQASIQCEAYIGPPAKHQYRPTSETPFKWRFAGRPMMAPLLVIFAGR